MAIGGGRYGSTLSNCDESFAFEGIGVNIRARGNSTFGAPKKPFRLKFDKKQGMLGLNGGQKYKSWVLMADYYDGSMLRTYGTFKFAKALMENVYYSSDCTHVEVYLNGEYRGVYLLCEQTQINRGRVDIPEMEEGDTSVEQATTTLPSKAPTSVIFCIIQSAKPRRNPPSPNWIIFS